MRISGQIIRIITPSPSSHVFVEADTMNRVLAALCCLLLPLTVAAAQTGSISGTVTDSASLPLAGAQITVGGTASRAITDGDGRFIISGLAPAAYELRAQRLGQRAVSIPGVTVRADQDTKVAVVLARVPIQVGGVVVSASRRTEKITEAPATVTRLDVQDIENSVGNSYGGALKQIKGLDFIQTGVMTVGVNMRGFNTAFNN